MAPGGGFCNASSLVNQFPNVTAYPECYSTSCSNRILLKGARIGNCNGQSFEYCNTNTKAKLIDTFPFTEVLLPVFPTQFNTYLAPSSPNLNLTIKVRVPQSPSTDILLLLDNINAYSQDLYYLNTFLGSFFTTMTDAATINFDMPSIGFATLDLDVSNNPFVSVVSPLTTNSVQLQAAISNARQNGRTSTSPTATLWAAAELMRQTAAINWRDKAYKYIVIITDNDYAPFANITNAMLTYNIIPVFYNPNPTSAVNTRFVNLASPANSALLPLAGQRSRIVQGTPLGGSRLVNWHTTLPSILKTTFQRITVAAGINTAQAASFIKSLPSPLNLTANAANNQYGAFTISMFTAWPAAIGSYTALEAIPMSTSIVVMGFGSATIKTYANRPPTVSFPTFSVNEDTVLSFAVPADDPDKNQLNITILTSVSPTVGVLTTSAGAPVVTGVSMSSLNLVFTPAPNWNGVVTLSYSATDGCANSVSNGLITITVNAVNDPPVARNITITVNEDETDVALTTINFSNEIYDVDDVNATLLVFVVTRPASLVTLHQYSTGVPSLAIPTDNFALNTGRLLRFVPGANLYGSTSFSYRVQDAAGASAIGWVFITVNSVNDVPVLVVPQNILYAYSGDVIDFTAYVTDPDLGDQIRMLSNDSTVGGNLQSHTIGFGPSNTPILTNVSILPFYFTNAAPASGIPTVNGRVDVSFKWNAGPDINNNPYAFHCNLISISYSLRRLVVSHINSSLEPLTSTELAQMK